jgi:hypothetical protein
LGRPGARVPPGARLVVRKPWDHPLVFGDHSPAEPRRRSLLGLAAAVVAVGTGSAVAGCRQPGGARRTASEPSQTPPPPTLDELARDRAASTAAALWRLDQATSAAVPKLTPLLARVSRDHLAHLEALGAPPPSKTAPTPSSAATPGSSARVTPGARQVVAAEWAGARAALADVRGTQPGMAALLARIAAARAVHADLVARAAGLRAPGVLTPGVPTRRPGSPSETLTGAVVTPTTPAPGSSTATALPAEAAQALTGLLAGEHAAVFAYGVIVARSGDAREAALREAWADHMAARDQLQQLLVGYSVQPPPAEPAYDIGRPPSNPAAALRLATRVEDGLAGLAGVVVASAPADLRLPAAAWLVGAARRAAVWRGLPEAMPGLAGTQTG